jgi:nicotinate-nucleotide pyrophosphorylase
MRPFEKYAVKVGGGTNHRYNLSDGVLIKDNHIGAAGSITKAVALAKEYAPFVRKIEVEVETLEQLDEALADCEEIKETMEGLWERVDMLAEELSETLWWLRGTCA